MMQILFFKAFLLLVIFSTPLLAEPESSCMENKEKSPCSFLRIEKFAKGEWLHYKDIELFPEMRTERFDLEKGISRIRIFPNSGNAAQLDALVVDPSSKLKAQFENGQIQASIGGKLSQKDGDYLRIESSKLEINLSPMSKPAKVILTARVIRAK